MGVSRTAFSSEAPGRWTRSAVARYASGVERQKRKAEYFLFQDEEDFPFVCRSAGLNPEHFRESLWAIRVQTASESNTNVA